MRFNGWLELGRRGGELFRRLVCEDDALELLEWAILAVIFVGLIGAYITFRQQVMNLVSDADAGVRAISGLQAD